MSTRQEKIFLVTGLCIFMVFMWSSALCAVFPVKDLYTGWSQELVYNHELVYPHSMCLDGNGDLLVYDRALKKVVLLAGDGTLSLYADLSVMSPVPTAIAYQPNADRLLVFDEGCRIYTFFQGTLTFLKQLSHGVGTVAVNSSDDSFYTGAQYQGAPIKYHDANGNVLATIVLETQGCFQLALNESTGMLYYSETYNGRVVQVECTFGSGYPSDILAENVGIPDTFEPIAVGLDGEGTPFYFTAPQGLNRYENGGFTKVMDSIAGVGQILWSPGFSSFLVGNGAGANIIGYRPETGQAEHLTPYVNAVAVTETPEGKILIADGHYFGSRIQVVTASGISVFTAELAAGCFTLETCPDGHMYAGLENGTIVRITDNGSTEIWREAFSTNPIVSLQYDTKNNALVVVTANHEAFSAEVWRIALDDSSHAHRVTAFENVEVTSTLPIGAVDDDGNIYLLERRANVIFKIADGEATASEWRSNVLDSEAITVPAMTYLTYEKALVVSTIETYELWPLDSPGKVVFARNNGGVDNFAVNQTLTGDLAAVHSGQVFRLTFDTAPGDVNGDKHVDLADAIISLQLLNRAGDVPFGALKSDVNGDSKIGIEEAVFVLQKVSDLR